MATATNKPAGDGLTEMSWDPITRIVGSLGIHTKIDFKAKRVAECYSTSSVFRGYSVFMRGKDPRDAHFITSRICGICGDNHATCSVYAQNMAYGVAPPHLGEWIINLGEAAEYMFDHNIFQENLVGVDYCERMVRETNPGVLELAERTEAPHAADHGYRTIADIMRSLNPLEGEFYREALQVSRYTREMFCLMEGRHVHPSTLYPGGVGTVATIQLFTDYLTRLTRYVEFMKRVVPLHDDLFDFFYEALPGYEEVGRRRVLLGCWGALNDPEYCDFQYANMENWGRMDVRHPGCHRGRQAGHQQPRRHQPRHPHPARQLVLRGLVGHGEVRRTGPAREPDRRTAPVEPAHHPGPAEAGLRRQVQLGHVAALVRRHGPSGPGHRRRPDRPAVVHGAVRTRRHRLHQGHRAQRADQPAAHDDQAGDGAGVEDPAVEQRPRTQPGPDLLPGLRRRGRPPLRRAGDGGGARRTHPDLGEVRRAGRVDRLRLHRGGPGRAVPPHGDQDGKIANYHPYPPTPWNGSVRDSYGTPGPYEDAVQNTPIFEENPPENFKGIDIMRAVRSFDPCLPCGVHMYVGGGRTVQQTHMPTGLSGLAV